MPESHDNPRSDEGEEGEPRERLQSFYSLQDFAFSEKGSADQETTPQGQPPAAPPQQATQPPTADAAATIVMRPGEPRGAPPPGSAADGKVLREFGFSSTGREDTDATIALGGVKLPGAPSPTPAHDGRAVSDTRIAKLVVESGLANESAVNICLDAIRKTPEDQRRPSLADVLVEKGLLSDAHVHALREVAKEGTSVGLLGGFQMLEKLGEGGMGAVYKARQVNLDRIVALKILPDHLASNTEFLNRFTREAKVAARLDHPNVVRAIDAGKASGKYYFAMEFVEGQSVEDLLERRGKLPEEEALPIIIQAAQGLECAWRNGLVHRDIKPDNILLAKDGTAKLVDLGLARLTEMPAETRLTQDGAAMGTPHYISPEQSRGVDVDIRSDIYSLGITLYRMVTGVFPFDGKDPVSIIMARFNERHAPANEADESVSDELAQLIETMMALDREVRYPDPLVLLHDLELVAQGEQPQFASANKTMRERAIEAARARGATTSLFKPIAVRKRRRVEKALVGIGAALVAAAAMSALFLTWPRGEPQQVVVYAPAPNGGRPAEDEALRKLEVEAASFLAALRQDFQAERYKEVVEKAEEKEARYASTSKAMEVNSLSVRAAARLEEIERRANEAAERQRRYRDLVSMAREQLAIKDYARATDLLIQAKALDETEEVAALLREAKHLQLVARGRDAEDQGKLTEAIGLYESALEAKDVEEIRARVAELKRRLALRDKLAEAEGLADRSSWRAALRAFEEALAVANENEDPPIEARIGAVKEAIEYDEMIAAAVAALAAERPQEALKLARSAAERRPDAERPKELVLAARKAIGPEKSVTGSLDIAFVLIPAGEFCMGGGDGDEDERPQRTVYLDAYYVSRYEITNAQFEQFDPTHRRTEYSPGDDMPVVAVSWDDAAAFCRWLTKREGLECRLPTEAEWEKAARGADGRTHPWGQDEVDAGGRWRANCAPGQEREQWAEDGHRYAAPAGSFADGASPFGVMDMAGNVWEWCLDWYSKDYYARGPDRNPTGPADGKWRAYRGGSFANAARSARCANRAAQKPDFVEASIGFRVVRALDPIFSEEPPKE